MSLALPRFLSSVWARRGCSFSFALCLGRDPSFQHNSWAVFESKKRRSSGGLVGVSHASVPAIGATENKEKHQNNQHAKNHRNSRPHFMSHHRRRARPPWHQKTTCDVITPKLPESPQALHSTHDSGRKILSDRHSDRSRVDFALSVMVRQSAGAISPTHCVLSPGVSLTSGWIVRNPRLDFQALVFPPPTQLQLFKDIGHNESKGTLIILPGKFGVIVWIICFASRVTSSLWFEMTLWLWINN